MMEKVTPLRVPFLWNQYSFIHELMHAHDYYYNPNYNDMTREELEERAMEEANEYRRRNNEPQRTSYE